MKIDSAKIETEIHELDRVALETMDNIRCVELHPEVYSILAKGVAERASAYMPKAPPMGALDQWQGHSGRFKLKANPYIAQHQMLFYTEKEGAVIKEIFERRVMKFDHSFSYSLADTPPRDGDEYPENVKFQKALKRL